MTFTDPLPLSEALDRLASLDELPTHLSSAELRRAWDADLRARSIFSARTTKAGVLNEYRTQLAEMMNGETNIATARAKIQDLLDGLGYDAERGGFPEDTAIPPAERGTLRDLSSNERVDLVLRTNMAQVANFADTERAMGDDALYWHPAWELVRVASRLVPRGLKRTKGGALVEDAGKDWPSRWEQLGGQFYDGHMIARKDDPIWEQIGSSANFPDALDASYPPYAFNSGFGRREVARRECELLGLLGTEDAASPVTVRMNEGLQASAEGMSDTDLRAIRTGLQTELAGTKLKLKAEGYDLATRRYVK